MTQKFLVIDVVDILFDNIYFSQVITELEIFFYYIWYVTYDLVSYILWSSTQ